MVDAGVEAAPSVDEAGVEVGRDAGIDGAGMSVGDASVGQSACAPHSCSQLGFACGTADDGCGAVLDCGGCTGCLQTCGGGGALHQCGGPACCPRTCAQLGVTCGTTGDGCGGALQCGAPCADASIDAATD